MGTAEIFPALFICPMWRVIHLPHTYLWPIYCVPGMVLSVRLSEFLVKLMDKSLPSGHFLRPTWLFVKTVLVTNGLVHFLLTKAFHGSSSLCFIFFWVIWLYCVCVYIYVYIYFLWIYLFVVCFSPRNMLHEWWGASCFLFGAVFPALRIAP